MTRSTWLRVSVATLRSLFTTRETVFIDTPASLATSSRVLGTRMQCSVTALSTLPTANDRVKQKSAAMRQDCAVRLSMDGRPAQSEALGLELVELRRLNF